MSITDSTRPLVIVSKQLPVDWRNSLDTLQGNFSSMYVVSTDKQVANCIAQLLPEQCKPPITTRSLLVRLFRLSIVLRRGGTLLYLCAKNLPPYTSADEIEIVRAITGSKINVYVGIDENKPEAILDLRASRFFPPWKAYWIGKTTFVLLGLLAPLTLLSIRNPLTLAFGVIVLTALEVLSTLQRRNQKQKKKERWIRQTSHHQRFYDSVLGTVNVRNITITETLSEISAGVSRTKKYTLDNNGCRVTTYNPPSNNTDAAGETIHLYGCSHTFGMQVEDSETFGWHLQKTHHNMCVTNFAVRGHSTYQALLTMEAQFQKTPPTFAIYTYCPSHDERNIRSHKVASWFMGPWCSLSARSPSSLIFHPPTYHRAIPGSRKCQTIKIIESLCNRFPGFFRASLYKRRATELLLLRMKHLCTRNNVEFIVLSIDTAHSHYNFFNSHGFNWCQPSSTFATSAGRAEWAMPPVDTWHPNERAHLLFSEIISSCMQKILSGVTPARVGMCRPNSIPKGSTQNIPSETYTMF